MDNNKLVFERVSQTNIFIGSDLFSALAHKIRTLNSKQCVVVTIKVLMFKKRSTFKDSCANHSRTLNPMGGVLFQTFFTTIEGDNKE